MALLFLCLIFGTGRTQKIEAADTETDQAAAAQDELLAELDFDAIQQEVDSLLSSQQFSFAGTVRSLLQDGVRIRIKATSDVMTAFRFSPLDWKFFRISASASR